VLPNDKYHLPVAPYNLSVDEKTSLPKVLKHLKVPNGYVSNIFRSITLKEHKLFNLKSYDYHILIEHLLPIAFGAVKDDNLVVLVCKLFNFFLSNYVQKS